MLNRSSVLLKLNVFLSDVGCGGSSLSACMCVRRRGGSLCSEPGVRASHMLLCPRMKCSAHSQLDGLAREIVKSNGAGAGVTRAVRGRKWEEAKGPGREVGLARVPHPGALAAELLGGTKSGSLLAAALPENPAERISFRFGSKDFAVVFCGWEEQKLGVASRLLPGSPLPAAG